MLVLETLCSMALAEVKQCRHWLAIFGSENHVQGVRSSYLKVVSGALIIYGIYPILWSVESDFIAIAFGVKLLSHFKMNNKNSKYVQAGRQAAG